VTEPTQKLLVALHKAIAERFKIIQGHSQPSMSGSGAAR
jgi:hypothetical protein